MIEYRQLVLDNTRNEGSGLLSNSRRTNKHKREKMFLPSCTEDQGPLPQHVHPSRIVHRICPSIQIHIILL